MPRDIAHRPRRVLFVGPAGATCHSLLARLESDTAFDIESVGTGAAGLAAASRLSPPYDAILIDIDLPGTTGARLCAQMRDDGINIPILLLAEFADEQDIIRGLNAGANDFIQQPFRAAEVSARLRAQIRAYETSEDAVLPIGPFQFRPARRMLQHSETNERVRLTEKEAAVLKHLYRASGPVPRTTLLHEVWGYHAKATTHTVETHIYRLRRKIETDPNRISLLINDGGGYRLCVDRPGQTHSPSRTAGHAAVMLHGAD